MKVTGLPGQYRNDIFVLGGDGQFQSFIRIISKLLADSSDLGLLELQPHDDVFLKLRTKLNEISAID